MSPLDRMGSGYSLWSHSGTVRCATPPHPLLEVRTTRLRFAIALLALAVAATPRAAAASAMTECYSYVYNEDEGTCGWTGEYCNGGSGCKYECESGIRCITWV